MSAHFDVVDVSENRLIETDEEEYEFVLPEREQGSGFSVYSKTPRVDRPMTHLFPSACSETPVGLNVSIPLSTPQTIIEGIHVCTSKYTP